MNSYQHAVCPSFSGARHVLTYLLKSQSSTVHTESWQGQDVRARPDARTHELLNVTLQVALYRDRGLQFDPFSVEHWQQDCAPNLPWADKHFDERVGGVPLNPPPSWRIWPWANSAAKFRRPQQGAAAVECKHGYDACPTCDGDPPFDHSYPERFWPKHAGNYHQHGLGVMHGIRFQYGDLLDVVNLLVREPRTRQAYLPIFFPEDTSPEAKRKPCTLGYQFILRKDKVGIDRLHCFYPMRSCDFTRHWADDAYLAVRLLLWVIRSCRGHENMLPTESNGLWDHVEPGTLTMHMTSLHVFENDWRQM